MAFAVVAIPIAVAALAATEPVVADAVTATGTAITEVRAGEAPLIADQAPVPTAVETLTLLGTVASRARDVEVRLDYSPRIMWRQAVGASIDRPLVLNTVTLGGMWRPSSRVRLTSTAQTSYGEVDYTTAPTLLGSTTTTTTTTVPASSSDRLKFFTVNGGAGAQVTIDRRWRFDFGVDASYREQLNVPPADAVGGAQVFPPQATVGGQPSLTWRASRRDELTWFAIVDYVDYLGQAQVFTAEAEMAWRQQLTRRLELRLAAGVAYGDRKGTLVTDGAMIPPGGPSSPVAPVGGIDVTDRVRLRRGIGMLTSFGAFVDYAVNPLRAAVVSRGSVAGRVMVASAGDWMAGFEGSFTTSINPKPLPTLPGELPLDETAFAVSLPVRRPISDNMILEIGGRWADRRPHLSISSPGWHQRQLWVYLMLTASTRKMERWRSGL